MLVPNTLKAKPSENYDDLIKQFFALKKLCESKMKQCSNYSKKLAEYDRESIIAGNEALESEREMNAQLTEELEAANERVKELEARYAELRNKVGISSDNIELEMNNKNHRNKIISQAKIEALQKIKSKAVDLMHKNWIISQSPSVEKLMEQPVWLSTDIIDSEIEQLRKEQGQ